MAAPTTNLDRSMTVTLANPTPPTNSVVTYQGTPPTPRGLAPATIAVPDVTTPWVCADPLNGATAPELSGLAEADGTEVTTSTANGRVTGHSVLGNWTEAPNASHPSGSNMDAGFPDATTAGASPATTFINVPGSATSGPGWAWNAGDVAVYVNGIGGIFSGFNVAGSVIVNANNVTVSHCRITYDGTAAVYVGTGKTGAIIEYCDIICGNNTARGVWVDGANGTIVRFCDISGGVDGIFSFANNVQIRDNYVHDAHTVIADPHYDCIQFAGTGVVIDHNTLRGVTDQNGCITCGTSDATVISMTINNNVIRPGPNQLFTMMFIDAVGDIASTVTNNRIEPGHSSSGNKYVTWQTSPPDVWTGNVNADTLVPIPAPT